ncbi:MAG: DUF4388 domain-containing protein [Planctomycetes bacterium]|nr:DUF4388 domain-containing protein [Planctomycetota bacterium]
MSVRGSAETVDLVDLLSLIHQSGHAGTLRLAIGERVSKLHFFRGQIFLPTGGSSGAHKIGALLVRAGRLTGRDLLRALAIQKKEGHRERLGDLLVRLQHVSRDDLDGVIRGQFEDQICDLLFEASAEYEFRKDVLPAGFTDARGNIQALGFDIRSILLEASRRQDEWKMIRKSVPSGRTVFQVVALAASAEWGVGSDGKVTEAQLTGSQQRKRSAGEAEILRRFRKGQALFEGCPFDGVRSVDQIVGSSGLPMFTSMQIVASLRRDGLLRELSAPELEQTAVQQLEASQPKASYKLFEWANEVDHLRASGSRLDTVLLRKEHLETQGFAMRTSSVRALQILSRLLRRGAPFHFLCRDADSKVEVFLSSNTLRLHLIGPRRTHSTSRYLRRRRSISTRELDQARETAKLERRSLDQVLLDDGYVTRAQWLKAVKDKAISGLFSIFGWSEPFVEVRGGLQPPPPPEDVKGMVCEIPLSQELRESIRRDLLRWKVLLKEIPTPDVVCVATSPSPSNQPRRAHDLFNGSRTVGDLIQLARVAPLELVRFIYDGLRSGKVRPLTDREHYERIEQRISADRPEEAVVYLKSAISWGFAPKLYSQRLREIRKLLVDRPNSENRPVLQGDVSTFSLAEVLQLLHQGQRSGTLRIGDGEREKIVYLEKGDLYVLRVDQSESEQEVWDLLLGDETRSTLDLEGLLKKRGLSDESEVGELELQQIKEDVFEAFLWEQADYEFTQNLLPSELRDGSERATTLKLNTQMLLMQAMGHLAEWDELREVLKSSRAVFAYTNPEAQLAAVRDGLGAMAYLYDGKHSLSDVVRSSGESRFKVYRQARDLIEANQLVFRGIKPRKGVGLAGPRPLASGRIPRLRDGVSSSSSEIELESSDAMLNSDMQMGGELGDSMDG